MFPSVRELAAVKKIADKGSSLAKDFKSYGHVMLPVLLAKLQGKPTNGAESNDVAVAKSDDATATAEVTPSEADAAAGVVEEKVEELEEAKKEVKGAPVTVPVEAEEEEAAAASAVVVVEEPVVERKVMEKVEVVPLTIAVVSDDDAQAQPAADTKDLSPSTSPAHPSCLSDGGSPTAEASGADVVPSDDAGVPSMPLLNKADVGSITPGPTPPASRGVSPAAEVDPSLDLDLHHDAVAAEVTEFAKSLAAKTSEEGTAAAAGPKKKKKKKKKKATDRSKSPARTTA